jgi:hypothetical protein
MNKNLKEFLHRGLMFGGFGPIVVGIVFACIGFTETIELSGLDVLLAIVCTYIIAFVQAGTTVFHQIEQWPPMKSALLQMVSLYVVYCGSYLINSWIPFNWIVVLCFTAVFIATYFIIWLIVTIIVRHTTNKLNNKLL